jgi:phage baseplate assembly protein W
LYNEKIRNLILTKRGEKLFDLNYGSEIYGFLFKTEFKIEDTTYASEYIKSLLKTNFSELFNVNIKVERKEDET